MTPKSNSLPEYSGKPSSLPAWVVGADECELRIALSIAWEALEPFGRNAEWVLKKPYERACGTGCDMNGRTIATHHENCPIWKAKEAMRQIAALGEK